MRTPPPIFIPILFSIAIIACEVRVTTKVDSRPSESQTIYGTTDEACSYKIVPDGTVTVTSGDCPVVENNRILLSRGSDGCAYAITRNSKTLIEGSCK